jgi:hypothetical protein
MKKSPFTTILMVVLVLSALLSVFLCYAYVSNTRELALLRTQVAQVNNNRALVNALANEVMEYSKKNPAVLPILESITVRATNAAPAQAPKPTR